MTILFITIAANLVIGALIGLCGVAGFLLPMLYTGFLGMEVSQALALSFLAFLVSGVLGAYNYHREGNLNLKFSCILSIGSFLGGLLGVRLNFMIAPSQAKMLLYLVVFLSGISILLRKEKEGGQASQSPLLASPAFTILFGLVTGAICSLSGAGGPVLVMPLLVSLGMPVRTAVGVSLFDSVFIALPACAGYLQACDPASIMGLLAAVVAAHGIGVVIGSKNAARIPTKPLKIGVAVFSMLISVYMLAGLLT